MADAHGLIIREIDPQPACGLLRTPCPRPPPVLATGLVQALHGGVAGPATIGPSGRRTSPASRSCTYARRRTQKWKRELDYALRKSLWAFQENRIAVRFQYEWHDAEGQWWRSYGNELWEFDEHGLMRRREASINDVAVPEADRRVRGPRPRDEYGVDMPLR
ncbi:hypothetical protein GCM10010358_70050 [Streptomyces minutiscleroticus]|uniref:DUF1348 family protein n=1 Tax=Streptomyces minutiscleroticus TaxID=68238 RepID=A0A918NYZ5_9ACTN|nr:hypothetical protein GCM10010358_70050 [Streptomyces minutiscleroticus]